MKPTFAAVDIAFPLTQAQYASLIAVGYTRFGRYYGQNSRKRLTLAEAKACHAAGGKLFMVYEDGPTKPAYFTAARGTADAKRAVAQATACMQPAGTGIASSVDFDCAAEYIGTAVAPGPVMAYQSAFHAVVKAAGYLAGVYGSGLVCKTLVDAGIANYAWLSGSMGFTGSRAYRDIGEWMILQVVEETEVASISVDTDVIDQKWAGCW